MIKFKIIYYKNSPQSRYLNIKKTIYGKPTGNIIFNAEKLKAFSLRSGTRQRCPLSLLLFNIVLKSLPQKSDKKKESK